MATTFASRLAEALTDSELNKAELARRIGMGRANVTHWLNGRGKMPSADNAEKAARVLGVNLAWPLRGDGPKRGPDDQSLARSILERAEQVIGVAKARMDLPREQRDKIERQIFAEAARRRSSPRDK